MMTLLTVAKAYKLNKFEKCTSMVCGRWRGNYGNKCDMWFPSNYVEEIESVDEKADSNQLGKIQKGSIELAGATVGKCLMKLEVFCQTCADS